MAKLKWTSPPPVTFLSGGEDFYRRREITKAVSASRWTGRHVVHLSNPDTILFEVEATLDSAALFSDPQLFIIHAPLVLSPELVKAHVEAEDSTVSLLLVHAGELTAEATKLQAMVPKAFQIDYPAPKPWDMEKRGVAFLLHEAKALKFEMPEDLAQALIHHAGADLGVLWFELLKIRMYMASKGVTEGAIRPEHVKGVMLSFREIDPTPIVDALALGSSARVLQAMDQVRKNFGADPTMMTVAYLGNQVQKWLHAAALDAQKASEEEALKRLDVNQFPYRNKILPAARLWKEKPLMQILRKIAEVEAAVKHGWIDPWAYLEVALVTSCLDLKVQSRATPT